MNIELTSHKNKNLLIISLLAIFSCFLWSTAFVGVKIGLNHAEPFFFAGIRFMISGLMLLPFCLARPGFFSEIRKHKRLIFIVSITQTFILYGLFFLGMTLIPGSLGAITIGSSPLVIAIMAHFFMNDDRMTRKKFFFLVMGIAGITIISISRKPWSPTGMKEFVGFLMLMGGVVSSGYGNIIISKSKDSINPLILNATQIFLGGLLLFTVSIPLEGVPSWNYPTEFYCALLWLSFVSAVAFSLWFYLLKRPDVKVSEINIWKFIIPVSGATLSWIFLPQESPELYTVLGMICVAVAIVLFYRNQ